MRFTRRSHDSLLTRQRGCVKSCLETRPSASSSVVPEEKVGDVKPEGHQGPSTSNGSIMMCDEEKGSLELWPTRSEVRLSFGLSLCVTELVTELISGTACGRHS